MSDRWNDPEDSGAYGEYERPGESSYSDSGTPYSGASPRRNWSGTDVLIGVVAIIVGLIVLGAVLHVVRALLWALALVVLAFLVWVGVREYQRTDSWGAAAAASGRTLRAMVRRLVRMVRGER